MPSALERRLEKLEADAGVAAPAEDVHEYREVVADGEVYVLSPCNRTVAKFAALVHGRIIDPDDDEAVVKELVLLHTDCHQRELARFAKSTR
jgi:hypothetical protein